MDKKPIFKATENDQDQRLDNFLLKHRKHLNKSSWYKLIRKGQVRVNGKRVKPLYKINAGDLIRIPPHVFYVEQKSVYIDPALQQQLLTTVLYEDRDYLVINKPAGLACHAGTGEPVGVIEIMSSIQGFAALQLGHRLDKATSGCLLLAKSRQALLKFQQAMQLGEVSKTYEALLTGLLDSPIEVNQPLDINNRVDGIRTVLVSAQGKAAMTQFEPIKHSASITWVRCLIFTGRTHQIRVHAQYLGMPIVGDPIYGKSTDSRNLPLCLHARLLKFAGIEVDAPVPGTFQNCFEK